MPFKIQDYLFRGNTRQIVYKSLDACMLRNRSISHNIANVNSPDYNRKEVTFEKELRAAMKIKTNGVTTNEKHLEIGREARLKKVEPHVYQPYDPTNASGVNNVDIDIETSKNAENQILHNYSIKFAGFGKMNKAITGRN